jgi:hypothetical protein
MWRKGVEFCDEHAMPFEDVLFSLPPKETPPDGCGYVERIQG